MQSVILGLYKGEFVLNTVFLNDRHPVFHRISGQFLHRKLVAILIYHCQQYRGVLFTALFRYVTDHFDAFASVGQLFNDHQVRKGIYLNLDFCPGCLRHTLFIVPDPVRQVAAVLHEIPYIVFVVHEFAVLVIQYFQESALYTIKLLGGLAHVGNHPQN